MKTFEVSVSEGRHMGRKGDKAGVERIRKRDRQGTSTLRMRA